MADSQGITIDPEVEEILRTVAADPRSVLLRVPRPSSVRGLLYRGGTVSVAASGLTPAEQHLVRSFRSDVARLLREACRMKLIDGPRMTFGVSSYRTPNPKHERWEPTEPIRCADEISNDCTSDRQVDESWRLLHNCVLDPAGAEPTVIQLAEASLRLESSDETRLMAALGLINASAPLGAIDILEFLLSAPAPNDIIMCAWNNLGIAYKFLGRLPLAHRCFVSACSMNEQRIEPWLNRLVRGLQLGLTSDVRDTCLVVEDMALSAPHKVNMFVRTNLHERRQGMWSPTKASQESLEVLKSVAGPEARRILNVFD